ncbi:MAG: DUF3817 domain-containing protein [Gemmataceae bacterium]|nr:DUF3817 domain-containing protein [Gemmata sp.]MDW8196377.1 DUF3817 domain-containing protein [Gemmataceae bacterium]
MLQTPIGRIRLAGLVEGVSALVLFFLAMPLKYLPPRGSETALVGEQVVFWVGAIHGGLFILYAIVTLLGWVQKAITFRWVIYAAIAAIVPFGPFVLDGKLRRYEQSQHAPEADTRARPR